MNYVLLTYLQSLLSQSFILKKKKLVQLKLNYIDSGLMMAPLGCASGVIV